MAYVFKDWELSQLDECYQKAKNGEVKWWGLYEKASALLEAALDRGDVAESDVKDTTMAMLWFDGAVQVNKKEGLFSDFIREYTAKQFELRYGSTSMQAVTDGMQAVSDAIAIKVIHDDILIGGGALPSMAKLASSDASEAGRMLFSELGSNNSAAKNNSAWSGALLFSVFGTDESWRLLGGGQSGKMDTLGDLRDVLFAFEAFEHAYDRSKMSLSDGDIIGRAFNAWNDGGSLLGAVNEVVRKSPANITLWEAGLTVMMQGEQAEIPIKWVIKNNFTLLKEQLANLFDVDPGSRTALREIFTVAESKFGADVKITLIDGFSSSELQGDFKSKDSFRYSIENFLPFVINEEANYSARIDSPKEELSEEYVEDRTYVYGQILDARHKGATFVIKGVIEGVSRREYYYDHQSDTFAVTSDLGSGTRAIVPEGAKAFIFGDKSSNTIIGADKDDHLYGMGGNDTLKGEGGKDYLEGGSGDDNLLGGGDNDTLLGMSDNDILIGGTGNDILNGGIGNDRYEFKDDDGFDRIIDSGGQGSLVLNGQDLPVGKQVGPNANVWASEDDSVRFTLSDLDNGKQSLLISYGANDRILIEDYKEGAFGLTLSDYQQTSPVVLPVNSPLPIDEDGSEPGVQYGLRGSASSADNRLDGGQDDDQIGAGYGQDTVVGGGGSDVLGGHEGDDQLFAEQPLALSLAAQPSDSTVGGVRGDWLDGGSGDDTLVGALNDDVLHGSEGHDLLIGGDGNDYLAGEGAAYRVEKNWREVREVQVLAGNVVGYLSHFENTEEVLVSVGDDSVPLAGDDVLLGGAGNDWLLGDVGNDLLDGGSGLDVAFGGSGDDTLLGGSGNDVLSGDGIDSEDGGLASALHGHDLLDGGGGDDSLVGSSGNDILLGGAGNDSINGDSPNLAGRFGDAYRYHGNDYLQGDSGNDTLSGGGGADSLYGGVDDDLLIGDYADLPTDYQGADLLDGGSGKDTLQGMGGADSLVGGTEDDQLEGDAFDLESSKHGDDLLRGDEGNDSLWGGGGADRLYGGADDDYLEGDYASQPELYQGADYLDGGLGSDTLVGDGGNDTLLGGSVGYRALFDAHIDNADMACIREGTEKGKVVGSGHFREEVENALKRRIVRHSHGGDRKSKAFRDSSSTPPP